MRKRDRLTRVLFSHGEATKTTCQLNSFYLAFKYLNITHIISIRKWQILINNTYYANHFYLDRIF